MQRQKSIMSFLQKPSTANCILENTLNTQEACQSQHKTFNSAMEIAGTATPPEKLTRLVLPSNYFPRKSEGASSLFSSIMHKFVKDGEKENPPERSQDSSTNANACTISGSLLEFKESPQNTVLADHNDVLGPETPGMHPLVPRFKRVQEDPLRVSDENKISQLDGCKRSKIFHESRSSNKSLGGVFDSVSKFEWLNPSQIKDTNGRRPTDPLYDRKTLLIPPDALKKMSASQKQYWSVKCQYMDVVLFFKVGKFYELYELDADIGHKELDWKITLSGVGKCRQVGISESGIDDAIEKLVARGYKVGRIEQLETSDQAKARGSNSVISRKLVEVATPFAMTFGNIGPDAAHLLALKEGDCVNNSSTCTTIFGFAFVDCAELRVWVGSICDDSSFSALGALLMQVSPREVIYEIQGLSKEAEKVLRKYSLNACTIVELTPVLPSSCFVDACEVKNKIESNEYFSRSSSPWVNAFDSIMHRDTALCALGGLIGHLSRLMLDDVLKSGDVFPYQIYGGYLRMDGQTLVNLEIFSNNADGGSSGTLFKYLDNCETFSGKRLLRKWICHPLKDAESINNRLNVVEDLVANSEIMVAIAQHLRKLPDLEKMLGRVKHFLLASDILVVPLIGKKVLKQRVKAFGSLVKGLRTGINLLLLLKKEEKIMSSLSRNFKFPEVHGNDGLDKFLRQFEAAIDSEFPDYQNRDVTNSEAEMLGALVEVFAERAVGWAEVIHSISCVDVLQSFSVTATMSPCGTMTRPIVLPLPRTRGSSVGRSGPVLTMKGLWHPFALGINGVPIPNDLFLGETAGACCSRTLLLTGPNMGGKSTLLRATCLAVIMAQLGCFVPCELCELSAVDAIFTRLGATDRIMTGESTFLVECTETATVLQNATEDSLVLLDELGRGTSTFDGYAIAYAVFRYLVEKVSCRLLFATHYHPLTKEFASHPRVSLQHMACAFPTRPDAGNSDLVFLYRLASGACPESYGLQVALMAGIPEDVVAVASCASQLLKKSIGENFKSSERRSVFSTLHEDWLSTLLHISQIEDCNFVQQNVCNDNDDVDDNDVHDTLFCLWHELRSSYRRAIIDCN